MCRCTKQVFGRCRIGWQSSLLADLALYAVAFSRLRYTTLYCYTLQYACMLGSGPRLLTRYRLASASLQTVFCKLIE